MGILRWFLASVVVVEHYKWLIPTMLLSTETFEQWSLDAGHAVLCFYVMSGFLISFVLSSKYNTSIKSALDFYKSRLVRIFPLYWCLSIIFIIFNIYGERTQLYQLFATHQFTDIFMNITLIGIDWRLIFSYYPELHWEALPAGMGVAWTLGAELIFYFIAPLLLRSLSATCFVFVFSLTTRLALVSVFGYSMVWTYIFFPTTIMFFLIGHLGRLVYDKCLNESHNISLVLGVLTIILAIKARSGSFDGYYFYLFLIGFSLSVPYLFKITKNLKWSNFIGDLSYPLYLSHPFTFFLLCGITKWARDSYNNQTVFNRFSEWIGPTYSCIIMLTVCTAMALILHIFIERPISIWLHSFTKKRFTLKTEGLLSSV